MEENIKGRAIIILSVLTVLLFMLNIGSCASSFSQGSARKKEMAQRMDLEEKVVRLTQEKAAVIDKLKIKDKELDDEKAAHLVTKKSLIQEQMVSQSLKDDLQKLAKVKESLELELKQTLSGKRAKK